MWIKVTKDEFIKHCKSRTKIHDIEMGFKDSLPDGAKKHPHNLSNEPTMQLAIVKYIDRESKKLIAWAERDSHNILVEED